MRLLILGGTGFVGRALAARAVAGGHQVTCAARGITGDVPPGARLVRVDRTDPDGLTALAGQTFDAALDISSTPSQLRRALAALAGRVGHWEYVSSCSAYADASTPGQRADTAPLLPPAPPELDDPKASVEAYGQCKVACEQAVLDSGVPAFISRPGLVIGPEDSTDRFTYWPVRLARGGEVLAPGDPAELVQFIDVRDLADWLILAAETGLTGVSDGIGQPIPRADFLARVAAGVGRPDPELTWVDQDFLVEQQVQPWSGARSLPLWLPLPEYAGFMTRDVSATMAAGLTLRELTVTARDTVDWYASVAEPALRCGLAAAEEAELLAAWRKRG
jgi:nucleoside-diphosphate-sugar epimerase